MNNELSAYIKNSSAPSMPNMTRVTENYIVPLNIILHRKLKIMILPKEDCQPLINIKQNYFIPTKKHSDV
jgi:hypothetical protein